MSSPAYIHDDTSWESAAKVSNTARAHAVACLETPGSYRELVAVIDTVWFLIARQRPYDKVLGDINYLAVLGDALQL